jgi:hypothetical protein
MSYVAGDGDALELRVGEERAVHLPPLRSGDWSYDVVSGMSSAVQVRKLWAADPYPDDRDDDGDEEEKPPQDVVFMVRGTAPGDATVRLTPSSGTAADGSSVQPRDVSVTVRL